MAKSLNKATLIGNVGNEPEIRTTVGGKRVANFSLATNRSFTDRSGQQQEKTEWHRCVAWERLAEIIEQYVHKGDRLYVEGAIEYSQTGEGNEARYFTNINVRDMIMLSGGGPAAEPEHRGRQARRPVAAAGRGNAPPPSPFDDDGDDDLPF